MCAYVSRHDTFKLFVTHIENAGSLLVVWGQRERDAVLAIERTLCSHTRAFQEGRGAVDITEVCEGQLCCAAYVDESFYRARVVSVDSKNQRVTVFFVDYGNIETVSVSAIRSLAGVGEPVADTPQLATSYLISRLLSTWTQQKLDFVSDQLKYCELDCVLNGYTARSPPLIQIMYMGNDYAEYLAKQGMGSFVPIQQFEGQIRPVYSGTTNMPTQSNPNPMWQRMMPPNSMGPAVNVAPMMNGTGPVMNNHIPPSSLQSMGGPSLGAPGSLPNHMASPMVQECMQSISPRLPPPGLPQSPPAPMMSAPLAPMMSAPPAAPTRQYIRMKLPPQKPSQYKSSVLEPGVQHPVFVSHVEDGPLAFSVQLLESHPQLESLMQEINNRNPEPVPGPLHAGLMCLARFMGDMSLCRALILLISEDSRTCKVYYVDYGNSDNVPFTHVFAIPHEFALPKVLSYRFALRGVDNETCLLEEKKLFKDMVQSVEAILVVAEPDGQPNKHLGDLYIDGKNVKLLLKEKVKKKSVVLRYPKVQLPREGSKDEVVISFVEETFKFFVQLSTYSDALNNLMESVYNHCTGGSARPLTPDEKIPGMPCCAMYTDGGWYRAVILNCFGDDIVVMYVDYGNEAKVKFSDLLNISTLLVSELRVQAIPCLLHDGKSVNNKLKELEGQSFTMHVISQKDAYVSVRLIDSSGIDIVGPPAAAKPHVTSPQSDGFGGNGPAQQQNFNDGGKGRYWDKTKTQSPGEDSGFNEDQNWRKPGRSEYNANNEEGSKPSQSLGFGDNRRNGGRFGDKPRGERDDNPRGRFGDRGDGDRPRGFGDRGDGDKPRGGFGDRGDGDRPRGFGDRGDGDRPRGFGDRGDGDRPRGFGDRGDGDKPRGGFGDRGDGDKPRGGFGDRGDGDKPRGGFGDRGGRFGDREDRPKGGFGDRNDRPRGAFGGRGDGDKPRGGFGDRDRRGGDRDFGGKGGRFGDRSGGDFGGKSSAPAAAEVESWDDGAAATPGVAVPTFPFTDLEGKSEDVGFVFGDPAKFFVHKRPENPDFTHLTETITSSYSEGNESHGSGDVTDGLLCIAFSADYQGWYRARVITPIEGGAHVTFIDYGNEEDVYYDNMKKINDDLKTLPPQAIPCTLRGVPAKEWSDDEVSDFATFAEADLRATFVELIDGVFSTVITNTASETANEKFGATPESLQPVAATYYVPDMTVENESSAQVEVSWFINPGKFYIQFLSSRTELTNLLQSIQDNFNKLKPLKTCDVGWFVLAKSKDDRVVYRAQIKKADNPSQIGVEFIDYGNCELVEMSSVYSMEPDYLSMPRQAVRSKLEGVAPVGDAWPPAGSSDLDNNFMGEMTCTVKHVDADGVMVVSLNRGGVDVAAEIIRKDLAVQEAPTGGEPQEIDMDLLPGQVVCGRVTYVNTEAKRLWVALEMSVADQLQEQVALCTAEPETLIVFEAQSVANGEWGLVLTSNSKYLRAEILDSTCAAGVLVRLVDIGSCEEVTPDKIYYLPETISLTPGQATEFVFDGSAEEGQAVMLKISSLDDGYSAIIVEEDICPLPILRRTAKVFVPYTNGTSVWIHLASFEQNVAELLDKLFEAYDSMAEDLFTPSEGSLCAAKSVAEEVWYRARIVAIAEAGVTVFYVDYGNTEVVPKENLRELLPDLKGHAFAREMQLTITSAEDLSAEITELTANLTLDAEFATKNGQWQIELLMGGLKLSKNLIDLGKATRREDSFFPEEITVYLAHLESLNEIYVHDEKESANLEALQAELQTLAETLEDGTQEVNSICLAFFKDDEMWYRAQILADGRAQFIDYGNADNVEKVKQLPEDKLQLKRYALKCSLKAPEGREWTPEDATRATELLCEAVTVKVLADGDPKVVEMVVGGYDLATQLVEAALAPVPPVEFTAYLAHLESLNEIYVHAEEESANLESLQAELQTLAETLEDGTQEVGSICLALFKDDDMWYRAEILADGRAQFIDYGNADNVEQVKQLPKDKSQLQRYALKCSLKAPEDREWTPEDATRATELLCEAVTVKVLEEGDPKVVEMAVGGRDLKTELVQGVTGELPSNDAGDMAVTQPSADDYPVSGEADVSESGLVNEDSADTELQSEEIVIDPEESCEVSVVEETDTSAEVNDERTLQVNGTEACDDFAQVDDAEVPDNVQKEVLRDPEDVEHAGPACADQAPLEDTKPVCVNESTLEKNPIIETANEKHVYEVEDSEMVHKKKLAEVHASKKTKPVDEVESCQVEDTQDSEPAEAAQVEDAQDSEPAEAAQVEDTQDSEPAEAAQVEDAQDSEPAEAAQVEDTQDSEPAEAAQVEDTQDSAPAEAAQVEDTPDSEPAEAAEVEDTRDSEPAEAAQVEKTRGSEPAEAAQVEETRDSEPAEAAQVEETRDSEPAEAAQVEETRDSEPAEAAQVEETRDSEPAEAAQVEETRDSEPAEAAQVEETRDSEPAEAAQVEETRDWEPAEAAQVEETRDWEPAEAAQVEETRDSEPAEAAQVEETRDSEPAEAAQVEETRDSEPAEAAQVEETRDWEPAEAAQVEESRDWEPAEAAQVEESRDWEPAEAAQVEESRDSEPAEAAQVEESRDSEPAEAAQVEESRDSESAEAAQVEEIRDSEPAETAKETRDSEPMEKVQVEDFQDSEPATLAQVGDCQDPRDACGIDSTQVKHVQDGKIVIPELSDVEEKGLSDTKETGVPKLTVEDELVPIEEHAAPKTTDVPLGAEKAETLNSEGALVEHKADLDEGSLSVGSTSFETCSTAALENIIRHVAGASEPVKESKDAQEVPLSQVEKDENSQLLDANETPLLPDERVQESSTSELSPGEKLSLAKSTEVVRPSNGHKAERKNSMDCSSSKTSDGSARCGAYISKSKRGDTRLPGFVMACNYGMDTQSTESGNCKKEETEDHIPIGELMPCTSTEDISEELDGAHRDGGDSVDSSLGVLKKVDNLIILTDELIAETSELRGTTHVAPKVDVDKKK